ncbi:MAG TPA: hypothetical protein ENK00_04470, partial [Chromatiales bacterium]|nr:hypothetical protein [Chromatiales bacterium]
MIDRQIDLTQPGVEHAEHLVGLDVVGLELGPAMGGAQRQLEPAGIQGDPGRPFRHRRVAGLPGRLRIGLGSGGQIALASGQLAGQQLEQQQALALGRARRRGRGGRPGGGGGRFLLRRLARRRPGAACHQQGQGSRGGDDGNSLHDPSRCCGPPCHRRPGGRTVPGTGPPGCGRGSYYKEPRGISPQAHRFPSWRGGFACIRPHHAPKLRVCPSRSLFRSAMSLLALGINHKTAPVEIREKVAFAPERMDESLRDLHALPQVLEAVIVSTCNRTELYCRVDAEAGDMDRTLLDWMARTHGLQAQELGRYAYVHEGPEAIRLLLRVASGLDSLVLGEPQILGQLKSAWQDARHAGTLGRQL